MIEIPNFKFALDEGLDSSFLPTRGTEKATGWDVRSAENILIEDGEYAKIKLGFRAFCPPGWWLEIRPRSSSFVKKNLHALYGVIDCDYRQDMYFCCKYSPNPQSHIPNTQLSLSIIKGEAIGQLIPVRLQEMIVEQISNKDFNDLCEQYKVDRAGGFGSTGK